MMEKYTALEQSAWRAAMKHAMLHRGDSVVVGVSGGADSVALFDFLYSIRDTLELNLTVCHINHNLRGEESMRDEAFVRSLCQKRGIKFCLYSVDAAALAKSQGRGVEETARELRYDFFAKCARPSGKIATAHTLNDNVETFLFRLARGSGARGLRGIPPVRDNIIRPLINCTRQEVEEHLKIKGLDWVTDSSNLSDDYARNRIRHRALPALLEVNPCALDALAGAMARIAHQQDLTESLALAARPQVFNTQTKGVSAKALLALPHAVGDELLMQYLEENNLTPNSCILNQMRHILEGGGRVSLAGGLEFAAFQGIGTIIKLVDVPRFCKTLTLQKNTLPQTVTVEGNKRLKLSILPVSEFKMQEKINKRDLNFFADYAKINSTAILRQKQDGDRIALPGRGSRLLKKLYQETAVPPWDRKNLLVLEDDQGLIWAERFGFDRRVQSDDAKELLIIEVLEESQNGTHHA